MSLLFTAYSNTVVVVVEIPSTSSSSTILLTEMKHNRQRDRILAVTYEKVSYRKQVTV